MDASRAATEDFEDRLLRTLQEIVAMLFIERATSGSSVRAAETAADRRPVHAVGRKRLLH
jgi:hypothetical protein